jgi:hypothetical protein
MLKSRRYRRQYCGGGRPDHGKIAAKPPVMPAISAVWGVAEGACLGLYPGVAAVRVKKTRQNKKL